MSRGAVSAHGKLHSICNQWPKCLRFQTSLSPWCELVSSSVWPWNVSAQRYVYMPALSWLSAQQQWEVNFKFIRSGFWIKTAPNLSHFQRLDFFAVLLSLHTHTFTHSHTFTHNHNPLCVSVFLSFIPQRWFILFLPSPPAVLVCPWGQRRAPSLCLDS